MPDAQILQGTTATLEARFYADGALADDDPVTITLTKADGTAILTGSATTKPSTGVYQKIIAALDTPNLLTATWTGATQQATTYAEVVGAHLFTIAALRDVKVAGAKPFQNTTDFPTTLLLERRAEVTDDFEARTGWSFIPRFARQTLDGDGRCELILDHLKATRLLSVTVNGVVQPLGNFTLDRSGVLRATSNFLPSGFFQCGVGNVVVEYVHGWDRPPATVSSAGLARTAMLLLPSQAGSTVSTWTTPDGTTYQRDLAGQSIQGGGIRHYGVPGIDAVLNSPTYNARGLAVA